jgi:hypothetical protein
VRLLLGYVLLVAVLGCLLLAVVLAQAVFRVLPRTRHWGAWDGVERRAGDRVHRPPDGVERRREISA